MAQSARTPRGRPFKLLPVVTWSTLSNPSHVYDSLSQIRRWVLHSDLVSKRSRTDSVGRMVNTAGDGGGGGGAWFAVLIVGILAVGLTAVAVLAAQRESVIGVAPEAGLDHWHDAYAINRCGVDLPASVSDGHGDGNHSHQDGLIHIHPSSAAGAGPNATFGNFVEAIGGELSDDAYIPGPGESTTVLSEEDCDGEPAVLQLAYWEDAFGDQPPVVITEDLAGFKLEDESLGAITLALLPEGAEIPKPPQERLDALAGSAGRPG